MRTTVYVDSNAPIIYRGINWGDNHPDDPETPKYSGSSFWSTTSQDTISLDLQAANIDIYGSKAPNHGNYEAKVYVPNSLQNPGVTEAFSGKSTSREFQKLIYSYDFAAGDQDNSVNKIRLGNKGAAGEYLDLDYIVATIKVGGDDEPIVTKQIGDKDADLKYSGSWNKGTIPNRSTSWTNTVGDSMSLSFSGSSIAVYGTTDSKHGQYKVSLDGALDILYNGTSSNLQSDAIHFLAAQLDQRKPHTLKITNAGTAGQSLLELLYVVVNSTTSAQAPAVPPAAVPVSTSTSGTSSSAIVSSSSSSSSASQLSTGSTISTATTSATSVNGAAGAIIPASSSSSASASASLITEVETSVVQTDGSLSTITKIRTHVASQTPPSTGKEAATSETDSSNTTRTGAIVGGALGAVVISCIVIVLLICLRRKRKRDRTDRRVNGSTGGTMRATSSFYGSPTSDFGQGRGGKFGITEKVGAPHDDQVFLPYLGGLKSRQGTPSPSSRAATPQYYPFIQGGTNTSVPREFVTGERYSPTREMERTINDDGHYSLTSSQGRELIGATIQNAQRRSIHGPFGERPNLRLDPLNSTFVSTSTSDSRSALARSAYPSSTTSPVLERNRPLSDNSELDIEDKLNRFTASALMSPAARSSYLTSKQSEAVHPFGAQSVGASSVSAWSPDPTGATPNSSGSNSTARTNKRAVSGPLSAVSAFSPLSLPVFGAKEGEESDATLVSFGATHGASTRGLAIPKVGIPLVPTVPEVYRSASTSGQAEPPSSARLRKLAEAEQLVRGVGIGGRDGLESDNDDEETRRTRPPGYYSRHFPSPG